MYDICKDAVDDICKNAVDVMAYLQHKISGMFVMTKLTICNKIYEVTSGQMSVRE